MCLYQGDCFQIQVPRWSEASYRPELELQMIVSTKHRCQECNSNPLALLSADSLHCNPRHSNDK